MKPHSFVFGLICLALVACTQPIQLPNSEPLPDLEPQATNWATLGGRIETPGRSAGVFDRGLAMFNNNPIVTYSENENVYVKRWNGTSWTQLGTFLDSIESNGAYNPVVALDSFGNPTVTWVERDSASPNQSVFVKRWSGTSWVLLGTFPNVDVASSFVSLALDSSGNPSISFKGNQDIIVQRWNGSSWIQLGSSLDIHLNSFSFYSSIVVDSVGNPIVAWSEPILGLSSNIYIKRWNGANWVQLGGRLNVMTDSRSDHPSLRLDSAGNPIVTWSEQSLNDFGNSNIYVKRWKGSSWEQLSNNALDVVLNIDAREPNLGLDSSGNPVVSWNEYSENFKIMYIKRWNGTSWVAAAPGFKEIPSAGIVRIFSGYLALDSSDSPHLALNTSNGIYVAYLRSGLWQPFIHPADRNRSKNAREASVALRSNNTVGVAWQEDDGISNNIHASFWNGLSWVSYGGTLNATPGNQAVSPSLAFQSNNFPVVAWQERVGTNSNIFVKQWNSSAWVNYGTGTALDRNINNQAFGPSLALDSNNRPYVAWYETVSGNNNIFVKRWDSVSSSWVNVGNALDVTVTNQSSNPSLAIDSMNRPVVAWQECMAVNLLGDCTWSEINVKRWNGSAWELLSDSNRNAVALSINPSLAINAMDIPVVAYQENDSIRVKRWNGNLVLSKWDFLGDTLDKFVDNQASNPSLDLQTNGKPVVAWTEVMFESTTNSFYSYLLVKRWTGASWQGFPSNTFSLNHSKVQNASSPSLVIGSSNIIRVGHQEWDGTSTNLYVTEF